MYEPLMTTHWRSDVVLGVEGVVRSVEIVVLVAVGDVLVAVVVLSVGTVVVAVVDAQYRDVAMLGQLAHALASQSAFSWARNTEFDAQPQSPSAL
jgi:uncharacterized membrane protein affecting hemolysin expression